MIHTKMKNVKQKHGC